LEQKNSDIKKKLDDFKFGNKAGWELFKVEFSREMDILNKAFGDWTIETFFN